ncbi:PREDICTED: senescence-associated carboxylesterase 101-like [Fragaria vesca subsp. vesca]|uniref:senescence-associated carboxylesterase 101-like n=1 Tax=Fragaria vesca subsp. vesca TaxID=101020 RepID=UPI0002C33192|nr:PREDICTED: senescence-associated carboxylesterase 101-like [Fragaria vesca subsp. vesca]
MTRNQFSSGLESANLVVTSDPVHQAWSAIEKQKQINPNAEPTLCNVIQESNLTIIAFGNPLDSLQGQESLVSSSTLKASSFTDFEFLSNKSNESFSVNQAAMKLFRSNYDELNQKKTELTKLSESSLIIITGQSMGGTVATLFTLWLLKEPDLLKTKRPLCITFGSPLVGDEHLRQCVLQFTTLKSCFLHVVVSNQDPARKLFVTQYSGAYKPIGSFLLCSSSGCACSEDQNLILEQLMTINLQNGENQDSNCEWHYGQILEELKRKALFNRSTRFIEGETDPLQASIITQLLAIGVLAQQQPGTEMKILIGRMKKHETELLIQKKKNSGSDRKLNKMKTCLALFEWYRKESNILNVGYYDMYKKQCNPSDINVNEYKKRLWNFWEDSVTEAENKPQLEGAPFMVRWLWAGTNYRRMVEPLHIAEFYKKSGARDYKNGGKRPKHFILLEKWLKKKETEKPKPKRQMPATVTEDSCFWAEVEEAIILCNLLQNGESITDAEKITYKEDLKKFEDYVWDVIDNYTVCPDIFLAKGTFMRWWKEYKGIVGSSYSSQLADYMNTRTYLKYT